tara:strand:+ start:3008 stop:3337 length:330 start_codon:yes stop_codon:yes gene_type:complete
MINNKFNILIIVIISLFLLSCESAKDAIQGKKRSKQGDEFLVQKKNPLIMPPDFEKLPVPGMSKEESLNKSSETKEIKSLLNLKTENENIGDTENSAGDIESSILKKIK